MPRRGSGPRLWYDKGRETFTIIDGRSRHRTGCGPAEISRAEKQLREYIERKHRPVASDAPLIADVIAAYAEEHVRHLVSGKHIQYDLEKLTKWWGTKSVADISAHSTRLYVASRNAPVASRRELAFLNAAITHWKVNHAPLMPTPKIKLPPKPTPRQDFMTRKQAAQFLWKARRTPHLVRFFLIGWYTGSRRGSITGLKWSMIDLESGVMQRKERNAVQTKKRAPPVRLGNRILAHLRRWHRVSLQAVTDFRLTGNPNESTGLWIRNRAKGRLRAQERKMGYTTDFTGVINLGRKLTMAEAKELLEIAEGGRDSKSVTGIDAYFQWVPTETMDGIVWDGNEKFYHYVEQLRWLCSDWLDQRGISANGILYWQGEETGDTGTITVTANAVTAHPSPKPNTKTAKPLTLRRLQEMALEQATAG